MSENESILKNLSLEYEQRFAGKEANRIRVWSILVKHYFQNLIGDDKIILDLGCGYGEFINQILAKEKYGMDLNPDSPKFLNQDIEFLRQDCSEPWDLPEASLDVVFTSNFFEHLPNKSLLSKTLFEANRCLRPGGRIVCMGPNIKFLPGAYWDFWDHFLELTDLSLAEGLRLHGFEIETRIDKFLPYTMSDKTPPADWLIRLYVRVPILWRLKGRQFLVIGKKI